VSQKMGMRSNPYRHRNKLFLIIK